MQIKYFQLAWNVFRISLFGPVVFFGSVFRFLTIFHSDTNTRTVKNNVNVIIFTHKMLSL